TAHFQRSIHMFRSKNRSLPDDFSWISAFFDFSTYNVTRHFSSYENLPSLRRKDYAQEGRNP
ncbi:hypothetical protein, partial [Allobaculum mucilyticum]|uniref:hypothetical protein n=1 Tax=Allobaculum mucilyticum TaxID=2834459 RepID=UPI001E3E1125